MCEVNPLFYLVQINAQNDILLFIFPVMIIHNAVTNFYTLLCFLFFFIPVHNFSNIQFGIPHDLIVCCYNEIYTEYSVATPIAFSYGKNSFVIVSVTINFLEAMLV